MDSHERPWGIFEKPTRAQVDAWFDPERSLPEKDRARVVDLILAKWPERDAPVALEEVFASENSFGDHDSKSINELKSKIADGSVALTVIDDLPAKSRFPRRIFTSGNTSADHDELCGIAATWLADRKSPGQARGWHSSRPLIEYVGGIADVVSEDRTVFVECGFTQARKVLAALRHGLIVMVVPYPDDVKLNKPTGFAFRSNVSPTEMANLFSEDAAGRGLLDRAE